MEIIGRGVLSNKPWQPLLQSVRFNRRVNVKKPRPPHYERARFEALAKPTYLPPIEKFLPLSAKCKKQEEEKIVKFRMDNPYENLIAKQCREFFEKSALVAICHKNPMKAFDRFNMNIRFKRDNMLVKEYGWHLLELALKNTKFEPILPLCNVQHFLIFSPEPNVNALLKSIKKTPEIILLAGIIDGYFANVHQFEEYARLEGDISKARAQLVSVLNSGVQSVVTSLNQHQTILVSGLDQYVTMKQEDSNNLDSKESETPPSSTDTPSP